MEEIYTDYGFNINLGKRYKDIYDVAMSNSSFAANYPGDAEILNYLYADIWNNETNNEIVKYK